MNKFSALIRKTAFCAVFLLAALTIEAFAQAGRNRIYSENLPPAETSDKSQPAADSNKIGKIPPVKDDDVIRIDTDLVIVPARITNRGGKPVTDLKKSEFKIFENDIEQQIAYFSGADQPFTVALLLDMSYSSVFKLGEIQYAALEFVNQLNPEDKVMVVSFDERIHVLCKPTNNRKALRYAIEAAEIASGTSLYATLDQVLETELRAISGRKAIVLLSDGVDTTSKNLAGNDILSKTAQSDVTVYPIRYDTYDDVQKSRKESAQIFYDENDRPYSVELPRRKGERHSDYREARQFLNKIAEQSGGSVYEVSSTTDLNSAFAKIAAELRKIYSLGYYPNGERQPGANYRIRVRVYRPDLLIRARTDYIWRQDRKTVK